MSHFYYSYHGTVDIIFFAGTMHSSGGCFKRDDGVTRGNTQGNITIGWCTSCLPLFAAGMAWPFISVDGYAKFFPHGGGDDDFLYCQVASVHDA